MNNNSKTNSNTNPSTNQSQNQSTNTNTNTNTKDIPVPNSLTITINTSVPGYQTIKYKPDMTVKNIDKDDKTIWFDPLVPLDQSVINKVPENIRVSEFFNKGLFESLINAHGNKKIITLEQAKKSKIIDNNIQITLNTLFPTNGILYIKGEPYAIADVQWSKSDWKIDRKTKEIPEIDVNKISDPLTFNAITKNNLIEGNKQLLMLPKDLIYGVNFNKETEELSSVDREKELIDKAKELEQAKLKAAADAKARELEEAKLKAEADAKAREAAKIKKPLPAPKPVSQNVARPQIEDVVRPPAIEDVVRPPAIEDVVRPPVPQIENVVRPPVPQIENVVRPPVIENVVRPPALQEVEEQQIENIQNIQMSQEFLPKLLLSQESTKIVRKYFGENDYYSMVSMIYKYMPPISKKYVIDIYKNTTNVDVKELSANISKGAYNFTLTGIKQISSGGVLVKKQYTEGLRIISNSGGGNCLFIAVADAINYYNYSSDIGKKILYNMYGNGDNLFTPAVLRNVVSTEIIKKFNSDEYFRRNSIEQGRNNLHDLNDIFERAITSEESIQLQNQEEYYNDTLLDVYKSHDNFFVIIPDDIQNRNRPFKLVENTDEIKSYIESPYYWADQKTIDIFKKILELNIITIQNQNGKFTLPYPTIIFGERDNWSKYLFLYNTDNHYELMTFDYLKKIPRTSKFTRIKKIIFNYDNEDDYFIPPFYIIFLIFGLFYLKTLPSRDRYISMLFREYFTSIYHSFETIIRVKPRTEIIEKFITDIKKYFGPVNQMLQLGGAINNNYNKYDSINRGSTRFLKKEDKQDNIQISFYITIDMELQKGTTLSKEQISNIKCIKGWNKVRKSFADFTGKKYVVPPVYENLSDKYNKKEDTDKDKDKDKDKYKDKNKNNTTKKITTGGDSKGRRRRKTMKYLK